MSPEQPSFSPDLERVFRSVVGVLKNRRLAFAISGALAQNVWGIPRTSADIDILFLCPSVSVPGLLESLQAEASAQVDLRPALESLRKDFVIRCRCGGILCELFVPYPPFHASVLARALRVPMFGLPDVPVATAEDIIVLKLLFDRAVDWADIEGILARGRGATPPLDLEYVRSWVAQMVPPENARIARLEAFVAAVGLQGWRVQA